MRLKDEERGVCFGNQKERIELIEKQRPYIKDAYEVLGVEEVKRLKYNVTNIKRRLVASSPISQEMKVLKLIGKQIVNGVPIERSKVKEIVQNAYNDLGISKTAKATDINKWFETKESTSRIDGKVCKCVVVIRSKIVFQ